MAKNAGKTVQALLARAPAPPPRAHPPAPSEPAAEPDQVEERAGKAEASTETAAAEIPMIAAQPRPRRQPAASAEPAPPPEQTAPPTLRLSQPIAEALRTAWLAAKRDRVLLTYQDFAGEIITAGFWAAQYSSDDI